jgi:hypothetical protein
MKIGTALGWNGAMMRGVRSGQMLRRLRTITVAALAVLGMMPASAARAQSCVLCYTSLANASPGAIRAFETAMLVLLVPTLLLFVGLFVLIFRHRATAEAETWTGGAETDRELASGSTIGPANA